MDIANRQWIEEQSNKYSPFNKEMKVLEIGSWIAPEQQGIVCRQTIAPMVGKYIGLDMRSGPGVDIVSDAKLMPFPDNDFHVIISTDCFEHIDWPRKVMHEAYRVLKQGGIFYLATVFDFVIHAYPNDYWRFTPECIKLLFEDAGFKVMLYEGYEGIPNEKPRIVRGIGLKE